MRVVAIFLCLSFALCVSYVNSQNRMFVDSLLNELKNAESDTAKVRIYIKLVKYHHHADPILTENYLRSAFYLSIKSDYKKGQADVYIYMGINANKKGEFKQALENYQKSLNLYKEIDDIEGIVNTLNNIALVHMDQSNYIEAIELFFQALEISDICELKVMLYINLGKLYLDIRLDEEGITYLEEAEKLVIEDCPGANMVYIYYLMGNYHLINKNFDKAEAFYKLSLDYCKTTNNQIIISVLYRKIGHISMERNNIEKAKEYFTSSLELVKELHDKLLLIESLVSYSKYLYHLKDYNKSEEIAWKAFQLSKEINFQEGIMFASETLSILYTDLNQYKKAYQYISLSDSIRSIIHGGHKIHGITVLKHQFEVEKERYQLTLIQQKKKINNMITFLVGFALLILFAVLYFFQRNKTRKYNLKQEYLNKELTSKAMYLAKKDEIFTKIENILQNKKSNFVKENQGTIQNIINEAKMAKDEEGWKEFELYFTGVHKSFYENLDENFPNLTGNERRLCALLRMNMNTKDISSVTHQSTHSIDIARTRLRKKLGLLNKKESLYHFLSKL